MCEKWRKKKSFHTIYRHLLNDSYTSLIVKMKNGFPLSGYFANVPAFSEFSLTEALNYELVCHFNISPFVESLFVFGHSIWHTSNIEKKRTSQAHKNPLNHLDFDQVNIYKMIGFAVYSCTTYLFGALTFMACIQIAANRFDCKWNVFAQFSILNRIYTLSQFKAVYFGIEFVIWTCVEMLPIQRNNYFMVASKRFALASQSKAG